MDQVALDGGGSPALSQVSPRAGAVYDGGSESIAAARCFAADFLAGVRDAYDVPVPPRTVGTVQLVVSELVTNACKYASGPYGIDLELAGRVLEITVWDTDPVLPVARSAEPGRVGQHGLEIVLMLCEGFDVRREPVGKRIEVRLSLDAAAG